MIRYSDLYNAATGERRHVALRDAKEIRKLGNEEMASIPNDGWSNAKVDTRLYYVSYVAVWEVPPGIYEALMYEGVLCRDDIGMRVVALEGNFYDLVESGVLSEWLE